MKQISLLFLTLFIIVDIKAQTDINFIHTVVSKIEQYKTVKHNSSQKWGNIGDINDYSPFNGVAIFKINLSDTIVKAQYNLTANDISDIYNENKLIRLNKKEHSFEEEKIKYTNSTDNNVISKMLYTGSIIDVYNILSSVINKKDYKQILTKDSVYNNRKVKNISIIYSDAIIDSQQIFYQKKLIIDKSTYLPLYYVSTSISEYGTQIIDCQLSDYKLNVPSDIQLFKSIKIPPQYKAYQNTPAREIKRLEINQLSPKLELPIVQGGNTSIVQNNGKVILLEFSGVHCGFCLVAVKDMIKIRNKYKPENLEILSVYSDASHEQLKKYIDRYKITYPILFNNGVEKDELLGEFGASGIPHFMIIGKDGKIKWNEVGYITDLYDVLCTEIERQLN